jgi:type I restriction enzyme S subunit
VQHIIGGSIRFEGTRFIDSETHASLNARCPVEIGDVLYSAVGSYGTAVPVTTPKPFSFQRHIAHIKPVLTLMQQYLVAVLNSEQGRRQAHKAARGVAQKTVSLGDLTRFVIPLPPLAEQHRIVAEVERRLSIADEVAATVESALARAARLRQSILKRAFEGKLVPQDPSDEPASVLLARIRAEREAASGAKPKRKRARS